MAAITFGTDGVRGRAHDVITTSHAFLIGRAAADVFAGSHAVIGRDTRESGPAFCAALAAGLAAGGVEAMDLGVAPTPAVAFVARQRSAIGVVVSASHNPWHDNGIKLFAIDGSKLSDAEQSAVETRLAELAESDAAADSAPVSLTPIQTEIGQWISSVQASIDGDLTGLSVVIDCANGAASHVVAPVIADLGASVTAIFNEPDGRNINDGCGSTHPEQLAEHVVAVGADLGLALDGDADRLLAVDGTGAVIDGDHLMAMLAIDMNERGVLADSRLIVTVMSNLGLLRSMERANITVEVTPVGDRNVLIALERLNATFGGEQSGHLIFADHAGTGDGVLSAVQLLDLIKRSGRTLNELAAASMTSYPQVLKNVAVVEKMPRIADQIRDAITHAESKLGADGRVLVRASGTERVVRVMVEAADADLAQSVCDALCDAVRAVADG